MNWTDNELRRIEEISQNASRPERGVMVDGWSVGLSPSKAKRSRCVNPFYASVRSFEENLATVRALYQSANLPCVFRLTRLVADATIEEKLAAMGCVAFDRTFVQLCRLSPATIGALAKNSLPIGIAIEMSASLDVIGRVVQALRGDTDDEITALIARWKALPLQISSYVARDVSNGEAVAHALTIREEDCIGIFDVITKETHRGRGLASALIARALTDAHNAGGRAAYLQVMANNPALRVYERLGFATAYDYSYREVRLKGDLS
ncbi:MAG: GNAT family N-acetyltransferase [Casimicrobium sp.]